MKYKFNLLQILQLENDLNTITFDGMPSGGLLADFMYQSLYFHSQPTGTKEWVMSWLSYAKCLNQRTSKTISSSIPASIKYLYAYTGNVPKNNAFCSPLLPYFSKDELGFISTPNQQNPDWNKWPFIAYSGIEAAHLAEWRTCYKTFLPNFKRVLRKACQAFKIPQSVVYRFRQAIFLQTRKYIQVKNMLKGSGVKGILTDHDRQHMTSCLMLAARKTGIITYTLVHGSTFPPDDYYPLLADYMLCWSESQKQQMQNVGISPEKLVVTGNQKLSRSFDINKSELRSRYKIPLKAEVVLLATNPIHYEEKIRFAEEACKAICHNNRFILLRIHPSENPTDYATLAARYKGHLTITGSHEQTADESLAMSDRMVCHNTVLLIEAIIKNIPVHAYAPNWVSFPLGVSKDAGDAGAVSISTTADELLYQLESPIPMERQQASERYINNICAYFGDEAAQHVVHFMKQHAHNAINTVPV
jgi:hypothetical protein